ncbi:transketolase central region [Amycolatopsis methanolica 239]|uniref:Transketolase central region n=1 Tax=Amycolatopsis methanolica 239 TaxID=1068978 RepID=A0A076N307_AMYME|nr:transketolase central region [Amycolatopsis methanolica 239]
MPGHPDEAVSLLREALPGDGTVYLRLSGQSNARPRPGPGMQVVRQGGRGVVLAVGPMLDRVLAAAEDMDVTVLYAKTVRPFDAETLRAAVARTGVADVVLVEPYLAGTSAHQVSEALVESRTVSGHSVPAGTPRCAGMARSPTTTWRTPSTRRASRPP